MSRKPHIFDNHPFAFPSTPTYRAVCEHVVDGDTIDVMIDLGLHKYAYEAIRVADVDTAELFRPKSDAERADAKKAKKLVEELVLGKQVKIETIKDKQTFGRYVAHVYYLENGSWVSLADTIKDHDLDWTDKK